MIKLIACTADKLEINEITIGDIWHPDKKDYIRIVTKAIRQTTLQEYLDFCISVNFPVRHETLSSAPYFYELEIMD